MDLPYLSEICKRYTRRGDKHTAGNWWMVKTVLGGLGLPLEETLQYLGRQQPTLDEFASWILERNDGEIEALRIERLRATIDGTPYSEEVTRLIREIEESEPVLSPGPFVLGRAWLHSSAQCNFAGGMSRC